ncbi:MAG TPA: isochorismatase family protein [Acidimicrobiales bacterium]
MAGSYDPTTALLVVDMQNDFADPAGSLYVAGGEDVVEPVNQEIEWASRSGAAIVYTQDWHPPTTPHFAKDGGVWPVHCLADSWGARFHPSLRIVDGADVVRKGQGGEDGYSAFSVREPTTGEHADTGLEEILRARGVRNVVIVGLATDYCVKETGLDAIRLGFGATVVTDAIGAVDLNPGDGTRALETIRAAGVKLA